VTILFTHIVEFAEMAASLSRPEMLVSFLNDMFDIFDQVFQRSTSVFEVRFGRNRERRGILTLRKQSP